MPPNLRQASLFPLPGRVRAHVPRSRSESIPPKDQLPRIPTGTGTEFAFLAFTAGCESEKLKGRGGVWLDCNSVELWQVIEELRLEHDPKQTCGTKGLKSQEEERQSWAGGLET